jgi:hypothetical protein
MFGKGLHELESVLHYCFKYWPNAELCFCHRETSGSDLLCLLTASLVCNYEHSNAL